ncbi:hypothetical protein JCM11641_001226 [Rhodosporidiobolus odoratus]
MSKYSPSYASSNRGNWRGSRGESGGNRGKGGTGGRGGYTSFGGQVEERHSAGRASENERLANRQAPLPVPSNAYLDVPLLPSKTLPLDKPLPSDHPAPVTVLSLNQSLIFCKFRTANGAKKPCVRPYLATFLEYVCGVDPASSGKASSSSKDMEKEHMTRFRPVVYSAMRGPNLLTLLNSINLIPTSRLRSSSSTSYAASQHFEQYDPSFEEGDVLSLVFSRESMGLSRADYEGDVQTTKNLYKVWQALSLDTEEGGIDGLGEALAGLSLGGGTETLEEKGAKVTVLLDDEVEAAVGFLPPPLSILYAPEVRAANSQACFSPLDLLNSPLPSRSQAQFPHSLLKVTAFSPSDRYGTQSTPSASYAVELPSTHPEHNDTHLLTLIYFLHRLRYETNLAGALRAGIVEKIKSEVKAELEDAGKDVGNQNVEAELANKGREVCEKLGIEVRRGWRADWREKMLEKEQRA